MKARTPESHVALLNGTIGDGGSLAPIQNPLPNGGNRAYIENDLTGRGQMAGHTRGNFRSAQFPSSPTRYFSLNALVGEVIQAPAPSSPLPKELSPLQGTNRSFFGSALLAKMLPSLFNVNKYTSQKGE